MAHKQLLVQSAAREKILHGAMALADAVRVTLGPKSKCVLIEKKWGRPIVCNDGVTIAKEFEVEDHAENLGAQIIRQAAERTGELVGDGTTTSILLAAAIFAEGVKNITAGASAVDLKRGLDRALSTVVKRLNVPGGGLALLRAIESVDREAAVLAGDERTGALILKRALEAPTRQIAENSAFDGGVVVDRMISGTGTSGFDASAGRYVDLIEAGIIDPTKVVRIALENAVSVASVLLLTEATLTEVPEPKGESRQPAEMD